MAEERKPVETPGFARSLVSRAGGDRPGEWWRTTLAGAAALILGLGVLWVLQLLAWPLALLIGGVALAAGLNPIVSFLDRWLPRNISIVVIYLIFLLIVVAILWFVIPSLVSQVRDFSDQLPTLIDQAQERVNSWIPTDALSLRDLLSGVFNMSGSSGSSMLLTFPQRVLEWVTAFIVVVFVSLYALLLAPAVEKFFLSLFPQDNRKRAREVVAKMLGAMGGFVRGTLIDGLIVGALTYVGLLWIGLPFELILAGIAGVMELVPVVGPLITAIILVIVSLVQAPDKTLIVLGFAIILQQVESNIIIPNVMREQAKISPLLTLLAVLAGERIGGLVGALVAIPLVAGLRVLILEVVAPTVRRWNGAPPLSDEEEGS